MGFYETRRNHVKRVTLNTNLRVQRTHSSEMICVNCLLGIQPNQLANGRSLAQILSQPGMPSKQTVYLWLHTNREFLDHYVRARKEQADCFADQCIEIADATVGQDSAGVAVARVRIEARRWRAGVLKPTVYSTKVGAEQTLCRCQASDKKDVALDDQRFAQLRERLTRFVVPAQYRSTL